MYVNLPGDNIACPMCAQQIGKMLSSKPLMRHINDRLHMPNDTKEIQAPHEIYDALSQYIIGQDKVKKVLSVAAYNHYIRFKTNGKIEKSNVLILGPSGSGKTSLIKTLAKILKVPLAITSATSLTEAGYIGNDVETIVQNLYQTARENAEYTEQGIIFIDEIDKLSSIANSDYHQVGRKGVQQALLSIIEGSVVSIPCFSRAKKLGTVEIDTSKILFICGGAFPDLEEIIIKRISQKPTIGFVTSNQIVTAESNEYVLGNVINEDLISFGMIPELIGRLPIVTVMEKLSVKDLVRILTEPKNSLVRQYQSLFAHHSVRLVIKPDALEEIALLALEKGTGARGLRSILEEKLLDLMFDLPRKTNINKVIITKDFVLDNSPPLMLNTEKQAKHAIIST